MRVIVTGATGNVGTSVVQALLDRGDEVVGLARRRPEWSPPGITWVEADVTRDDLVGVFRGGDAVVHLAWAFQPTHRPKETWRVNVGGTERVLTAVDAAGVPALVHASSVGAYSPGPKEPPVTEDWPTEGLPTAGYGREKAYAERLLDAFELANPGIRVVRLRPAFIFKEAAAPEQMRIFAGPLVPRRVVGSGKLPVMPDVDGLRFQALHAEDVAEAYAIAVHGDARGAFNVAADPVVGAAELADVFGGKVVRVPRALLRSAVATAWHLRLVPASPYLLDLFLGLPLMDTTRARTALGWTPRHSSLDALRAFTAGLRAGTGMDTPPLHA